MQELSYKTFSSLMASVEESLRLFADNNLIKRSRYIKIARQVNSDLGIKINQVKEEFIDVENYRASLPADLLSIIAAIVVEDKNCHNTYDVIREWQYHNHKYKLLHPTKSSLRYFSKFTINKYSTSREYQIDVVDGEITLDKIKEGRIYLAYVCDMISEDRDLLVLDHPLVNPYYESAIRAEILKDLWYNIDADTQLKWQNEFQNILPSAKKAAIGIVTFPGYKKLKEYSKRIESDFVNQYHLGIV